MTDTRLKDPLERELVLQDRTWLGHIVKGHPEVRNLRAMVEKAVEAPDEIWISRSDADCRIYFAPGPRTGVIIMVVADVAGRVVKTAHLCKAVSGERLEWSK